MVGRRAASLCHELRSVLQVRFVLIVGSAAELDVVGVVRSAPRVWDSVVELDLPCGGASAAFGVDEGASTFVSLEYLSAGLSGNCARLGFALLPTRSRFLGERCLLLLRFDQERV
jgi:hypothetical protein